MFVRQAISRVLLIKLVCLSVVGSGFASPKSPGGSLRGSTHSISQSEADQIALEAYIYLYPLVLMDVTRRVMTSPEGSGSAGNGPMNTFSHMRAFPPGDFRDVVRPNFDTLYSIAWLDLTKEPVVVSHGDTKGRFFLLPMIDMWSDVFAVPGKRTSGTGAKDFVVVGPHWKGNLPEGPERINATSPYVWIIGRTQTNGPSDYKAVHDVQKEYGIVPLSKWQSRGAKETSAAGQAETPKISQPVDLKVPPLVQVNAMSAEAFFSYGNELMSVNPPHHTDWSQVARLRRIGLDPQKSFDWKSTPKTVQKALERAPSLGLKTMQDKIPTLSRVVNGWQMNTDTMGVYGNSYLKRAIVAMVGLGANQVEDAIYPLALADGNGSPLVAGKTYVLRFEKSELPPVDAFWSVTMYDSDGFPVPNSLNRFALGDRDDLVYGKDGSLEILIQESKPDSSKVSNWLPAPATGKLGLTMRLYAPRASVVNGQWQPPAIRLVEKTATP